MGWGRNRSFCWHRYANDLVNSTIYHFAVCIALWCAWMVWTDACVCVCVWSSHSFINDRNMYSDPWERIHPHAQSKKGIQNSQILYTYSWVVSLVLIMFSVMWTPSPWNHLSHACLIHCLLSSLQDNYHRESIAIVWAVPQEQTIHWVFQQATPPTVSGALYPQFSMSVYVCVLIVVPFS